MLLNPQGAIEKVVLTIVHDKMGIAQLRGP